MHCPVLTELCSTNQIANLSLLANKIISLELSQIKNQYKFSSPTVCATQELCESIQYQAT